MFDQKTLPISFLGLDQSGPNENAQMTYGSDLNEAIRNCVNVNLLHIFWSAQNFSNLAETNCYSSKACVKKETHWIQSKNFLYFYIALILHLFHGQNRISLGLQNSAPYPGEMIRSWKWREMTLSASSEHQVTNMYIPPGCFSRQDKSSSGKKLGEILEVRIENIE